MVIGGWVAVVLRSGGVVLGVGGVLDAWGVEGIASWAVGIGVREGAAGWV